MSGLKILQVGSSMPNDWGGIERYVAYLSPALVNRGHEVFAACVPGSPLESKVGIPTIPARVRHKYDFRGVADFLRVFKDHKFDIVNTHFSPDYLVPAWAARIAKQGGMVLTRHLVLKVKPGRVRTYCKLYDHFIGVSGAASNMLLKCGFPEGSVSTALAGIPPLKPTMGYEAARSHFGMAPDEQAVSIFGRLVPEKGHVDLMEAVRRIGGRAVCHVFGEGMMLPSLKLFSKGLPVVFHGYVPDVANAMVASDVIAMPSKWEEALGIAVLEAFSVGKPVIAAKVGGIPEVVVDGSTGILANTSDHDEFEQKLRALLSDEPLRNTLGQSARTAYLEKYTPQHFAERTEAVYLRVCQR